MISRLFKDIIVRLAIFTAPFLLLATVFSPAQAENRFMISAANPHAAQAGHDILARGGSAVDAAIATQMVLTLVEPQSSGIGGGAFMLHFDGGSKTLTTFDGRETAPAQVDESYFLKDDGTPYKFYEAVVGGRAVGVPGVLAMLEQAHQKYGKRPWAELFEAAIALSEQGFAVSPRLFYLLDTDKHLRTKAVAAAYFYDADGSPHPVGHMLKNPALAASFRAIAKDGAKAFYTGAIARDIVAAAQSDPDNPGLISLPDLAAYRAKERPPVCIEYRITSVCGMGPPTSGGITSLQILKILEKWDLSAAKPGSLDAVSLISKASALAFADRGKYLADSDFVPVPTEGLLNGGYLAARAALIEDTAASLPYKAGQPAGRDGALSDDNALELPSTSHFSIVDGDGNAVSMTTSVENVFGSRLMAGGFILNNQLTDFSFRPHGEDGPVANRIEPGKRPRSSMSPTMAFNGDGSLRLVVGSPGGSRIIGYVTKTVIGVLDWGLTVQAAINLPHHINRNGTLDLEAGTPIEALQPALEKQGFKVTARTLNSGLHAIEVTGDGLRGGADPRREGIVLGN
ncbi:gamma-glutamyltransferase [Sneathiella chinensis]|uniref:Glutathione hydrolase proenzyme n=1 Tax=Sneathiella chinensis TaxID=349750 RepID=A0ABQ5U0S5_9PROT|nr:gamma-glutamyltransferase [Sneathiella chinensis]GLQ05459.1 gamma-glutamyltranspeptidase [Sneathiella chinensis]